MKRHAIIWILAIHATFGAGLSANAASQVFLDAKTRPTDPEKTYPRFHIGVTGIHATVEKGLQVTVHSTDTGTPAAGKFKKGDVLLTVNGRVMTDPEPYICLGEAITAAEATDGKLTFSVMRGEKTHDITLTIPVLGAYSKTWPLKCKKSDAIVKRAADRIASELADRAIHTDYGYFGALALLSTGDDSYLPVVKTHLMKFENTSHTWQNGYFGIAMAEYYLRTGDKEILPKLQEICDDSVARQKFGTWNHWGPGINPGYVQGGLMNPAGLPVFTTLILGKECGIAVDQAALEKSLTFFYRFVGHGSVPYGNHRGENWLGCNGKNAMLATALSLLDGGNYRKATTLLAMDAADAYSHLGAGHGSSFPDQIWRGIGVAHLPGDKMQHYRRCMDKLTWYYDLCRRPDGNFSLCNIGSNMDDGTEWGEGLVLAYTAPRRAMRITGASRTRFSQSVVVPERPWGRQTDLVFLSSDHCEGFGSTDLGPHEIRIRQGKLPGFTRKGRNPRLKLEGNQNAAKAFCVQMMRHRHSVMRQNAAKTLVALDALDEIGKALEHPDARVRRAALEGIDNYDGFFGSKAPLEPSEVSERFVSNIEKILANPNISLWELDGAVRVLSRARPEDIHKHIELLRELLNHEEWWLRQSAVAALLGMAENESLIEPEIPDYLEALRRETVIMVWRRMMGGLQGMLKSPRISAELKRRIADGMLGLHQSIPIADGEMANVGITARQEILGHFYSLYPGMTPQVIAHLESAVKEHGLAGIGGARGFESIMAGKSGVLGYIEKMPVSEQTLLRNRCDKLYAAVKRTVQVDGEEMPSRVRMIFEPDERSPAEQIQSLSEMLNGLGFETRKIQEVWNMHGPLGDADMALFGVRHGPPGILAGIFEKPAAERAPLLQQLSQWLRELSAIHAGFDPEKEDIKAYDHKNAIGAKGAVVKRMKKLDAKVRQWILKRADDETKALFVPEKLKIFILAGQSNMVGHSHYRTVPALLDDTAPGAREVAKLILKEHAVNADDVRALIRSGQQVADLKKKLEDRSLKVPQKRPMEAELEKLQETHDVLKAKVQGAFKVSDRVYIHSVADGNRHSGRLSFGYGANMEKLGPELGFGMSLEQKLDGPILLIKTAWGGKSLHYDFRSPSAGVYPLDEKQKQADDPEYIKQIAKDNELYKVWLAEAEKAIKAFWVEHDTFMAKNLSKEKYAEWRQQVAAWDQAIEENGGYANLKPWMVWALERKAQGFFAGTDIKAPVMNFTETLWKERPKLAGARTGDQIRTDAGTFWRKMTAQVHSVLDDVGKYHPDYDPEAGYEVAGFVWFQGYNDQFSEAYRSNYKDNMVAFIKDARKEFSNPKMPFVIGVLGTGGTAEKVAENEVSVAQRQAAADPQFKGTVKSVESYIYFDHTSAAEWKNPKDRVEFSRVASDRPYHYMGSGKLFARLGDAMAEAMGELMGNSPMNAAGN